MTVETQAPRPWVETVSLDAAEFAHVRRRSIFDCAKWDPQVEDASTLARFPIVLRERAWQTLACLAEKLAAEASAAEAQLLNDGESHKLLALPWRVRRALAYCRRLGPTCGAARVTRFDFHWTRRGWRISEANSDVPGGFNEASGFSRLMAHYYPDSVAAGDPVESLADSIALVAGQGARVALVHATSYTDDRQVMAYLAMRWSSRSRLSGDEGQNDGDGIPCHEMVVSRHRGPACRSR